jgi:uncharacterized Tic20 family protein
MAQATGPQAAPAQEAGPGKDERMWAMLCHLAALAAHVCPFGNVVGPLVVWLIKKDEYPLVDDQGKEAVNFQITMTIAGLLCLPLVFVIVGIFLAIAVYFASFILAIVAAVRANGGERYRYPFSIRFIR